MIILRCFGGTTIFGNPISRLDLDLFDVWWYFTNSTMVNHHVSPPFEWTCFTFSKHLEQNPIIFLATFCCWCIEGGNWIQFQKRSNIRCAMMKTGTMSRRSWADHWQTSGGGDSRDSEGHGTPFWFQLPMGLFWEWYGSSMGMGLEFLLMFCGSRLETVPPQKTPRCWTVMSITENALVSSPRCSQKKGGCLGRGIQRSCVVGSCFLPLYENLGMPINQLVRQYGIGVCFLLLWHHLIKLPYRELTYPTLGKGKSSWKVPLGRDMLVPRRVSAFFSMPFSHFKARHLHNLCHESFLLLLSRSLRVRGVALEKKRSFWILVTC